MKTCDEAERGGDMEFSFSAKQRQTLAAYFRLLPDGLVQLFLNRCEHAITAWQAEWPKSRQAGTKDANAHLRALSSAIHKVRGAIEKLPDGASHSLWMQWQCEHGKDTLTAATHTQAARQGYIMQLLELEQLASRLAGDLAHAGGMAKYCESDLVDGLVRAYMGSSFDRKPSAAGESMFMKFVGEIATILPLPGGARLTLGKDLVASSIKWHLAQAEQEAKWTEANFEFPQSKQGS